MDIANQDKLLIVLNNEIKKKKSYLNTRYKDITKTINANSFLNNVKDDYDSYYNYILDEREQQYNSLTTILDYLDRLILEEKLSDMYLQNVKKDQEHILTEMNHIKKDLDDILDTTTQINLDST